MKDALSAEYRVIADLVSGLEQLERDFLFRRDLRGVFATAYLHITRAIEAHLLSGGFHDEEWVRRYLLRFGNLYREALLQYETGQHDSVPKAWRKAFDAAAARVGLVIQHLALGINAHINHDLALALTQVGIEPDRPGKRGDHLEVNSVLQHATAGMKHRVAEMYAPILHRLDRIAGRTDDDFTNFSIPRARDHAWTFASAITDAHSPMTRQMLKDSLDEQAAVIARLILASPTRNPLLLRAVRTAQRVDALFRRR